MAARGSTPTRPLVATSRAGWGGRTARRASRSISRSRPSGCPERLLSAERRGGVVVSATVELPEDLIAWVEEVGGGQVTLADRRPGGARKEAWFVDLEKPDGA